MSTEISTLLVSSPDICGGRLHVGGTGITVNQVVSLYKRGSTAEEIVVEYPSLTMAQVYAALAYYHANQDEIEADLVAESQDGADSAKDRNSLEREVRLRAFKTLQRNLSLTPTRATEWQEAVREARR
ncbi:MAG TPA: DUF433 domain-containing protein [Pyrinomonadaceae bacterium]|nr:DUF433 domain-containing protein [Pyrinomonadaceae bacterium]